ncbi:MAG: hypothetical protein ACR2NX_06180 [Chthoniobacterales bacterium]
MRSSLSLLVLTVIFLTACGTAKDVAVTSFKILDAPAHYVRRQLDENGNAVTTTTVETRETSDISTPGRPVNVPPPPPVSHTTRTVQRAPEHRNRTAPPSPSPVMAKHTAAPSTPRTTPTAQFPTAKPVPGKPGYVYSVDPKGGIVDVTGYKPGDKAKDPYTQKIFVVP